MAQILVVDDSPTEMHLIKAMLTGEGHQVIEARNGRTGVALTSSELPDLVLMDVVMPGMNGFQATRQICKNRQTRHIPVVIVSTKDQQTDRLWGQRQGARGYLVKPLAKGALIELVDSLLVNSKSAPGLAVAEV